MKELKEKKVVWKMTYGEKELSQRRPIKPIGRLIINGKLLSMQETVNYLKANK